MTDTKVIKRLDHMEAIANMMLNEASLLRKELGLVSASTPQQGHKKAIIEATQKVIARRRAAIQKRFNPTTNA